MAKFLLLLLAVFLLIPRLLRLLAPRPPVGKNSGRKPDPAPKDERLQDLTRQDISDADYEEIPPEE